MTLDVALKVTNRRVNALENVVKPKIENTISYIKVWRGVTERSAWLSQGCDTTGGEGGRRAG
jgi:vacuolar-type H+-ATPase subunit D/Vma8